MSVAENIANGLRALQQSQADRTWAAAGAFVATVGTLFAMVFSVTLFYSHSPAKILLSILIVTSAVWGTASLYFYSFATPAKNRARPVFQLGLWVGVFLVSGIVYFAPVLVLLGIVPCVSAWAILRRTDRIASSLLLVLPLCSVLLSLLLGRSFWGP